MVPRDATFKFANADFVNLVRLRLYIDLAGIVDGSRCRCKAKTLLDKRGHHLLSGCKIGHWVSTTHDHMVLEIKTLATYCGFWCIREERDCFKNTNPFNNRRPDVSIMNPLQKHTSGDNKLLLDAEVTNPVPGSKSGKQGALTMGKARQEGSKAEEAFKGKNKEYLEIATANGLSFLPIIFESTGRVHPKAMEFFKDIAKHKEEITKIPKDRTYGWMMNRLSCVLMHAIAKCLNTKIAAITSHISRAQETRPEFSAGYISSHAKYRSRGRGFGGT